MSQNISTKHLIDTFNMANMAILYQTYQHMSLFQFVRQNLGQSIILSMLFE